MYSCIFDEDYNLVMCTNYSAKSLGFASWEDAVGINYKDNTQGLAQVTFGDSYNDEHKDAINKYAKLIYNIQKSVFTEQKVISFFDLLPYNNQFNTFLVTYIPIFDKYENIVAIQSYAIESKFFGFQEHFYTLYDNSVSRKTEPGYIELTKREEEIMFLLANGLNQEQIAHTLQVSRSTVSSIIANRLSVKFNIAGSNTTYLTKIAMERGYFQHIPPSLFRPFVVPMIKDE